MSGARSWLLAVVLAACGAPPAPAPPGVTVEPTGDAVGYDFTSLDDRPVSSAAFAGRPVLLAFVTTYDPMSQLQVNVLVPVAADFPEAGVALVALQDASSREFVQLYQESLHVPFPVAMAGPEAVAPFGAIHEVPTVIILGRNGRIRWRHTGPVRGDELRSELRRASR